MKTVSTDKSFGGTQGVYSHQSEVCGCEMTFAVFVPPQASKEKLPVLWYLSGLTCTHANVMDKGEYRRLAAELGLIIVCPDTSPRGEGVPDEPDNWHFGKGAGFYLDATQAPFASHYRMYTYIVDELPKLIESEFPADMSRQGILGHSMGGHGAITIALKNPGRYASCSAFAPISHPSISNWSRSAFEKYLGADRERWREYDVCNLIEDGRRIRDLLVDQGTSDSFLEEGLRPLDLKDACREAGIPLTLRMHDGYGHSYLFISTFMDDHLRWHAERLRD
ncbi:MULTISPECIES: S-formylglutathione hydrolase [Rhizobium/Agrobacterium group]|uniref:S-formylglutathione hydrolase n=1 Tax=Rhizobium/Agrobacterium group TaxID=227290 RepID=UPI001ADCBF3B|nr:MULTISPECIES: S-formylglutathione hydrolase [Rhizobium/Agrobacterium group]MBO9112702.1 S-formylglutathione hydrolase [Agrobacterium sp. S2/73]QXZ76191.1 S-formylglutathione hydrolase [Agrobacterium sp. S7/73]QYA17260.1 S-formylglutathione hydrolase [Rhizobium sp. AB2/73]UEQ85623.1 S-formylglutathione hydrolase [Rhizobium sp. AB2/73]